MNHHRHELPPAEHWGTRFLEVGIAGERAVIALGHRTEEQEIAREIEPAEDLADDWHDDVRGEARRDCREGGADDDCNREIEDVAAGDEGAEFLEHVGLLLRRGPTLALFRPIESEGPGCVVY